MGTVGVYFLLGALMVAACPEEKETRERAGSVGQAHWTARDKENDSSRELRKIAPEDCRKQQCGLGQKGERGNPKTTAEGKKGREPQAHALPRGEDPAAIIASRSFLHPFDLEDLCAWCGSARLDAIACDRYGSVPLLSPDASRPFYLYKRI